MINNKNSYLIVIPARYSSTRLPGKPLLKILKKTMLFRVWETCIKVDGSDKVLVATDDKRIAQHCEEMGMNFIMTSKSCKTGTDRVIEVAKKIKCDFYINVQGDEPLINKRDISKVIDTYKKNMFHIVNGMAKISNEKDFRNLNVPKVVTGKDKILLYISRSSIPISKKNEFHMGFRQVCIYAFSHHALRGKNLFNKKSKLELIEDIEILRFLEHGYKIKMVNLSDKSIAVDTSKDLLRVKKIFDARK